jgi:hypothetical protein
VWSRAQQTFHTSPHLVRHISRLDLHPVLSPDTFTAICAFPFTNLRSAHVFAFLMTPHSALALQQLLSQPTLRDITIGGHFADGAPFMQIWNRCSPSIQHLHLDCRPTNNATFHPIPPRSSPLLHLESLRLRLYDNEGFRAWLNGPMCPFDFSRLKTLSIRGHTGNMSLTPCAHSLQVLDISFNVRISTLSVVDAARQI